MIPSIALRNEKTYRARHCKTPLHLNMRFWTPPITMRKWQCLFLPSLSFGESITKEMEKEEVSWKRLTVKKKKRKIERKELGNGKDWSWGGKEERRKESKNRRKKKRKPREITLWVRIRIKKTFFSSIIVVPRAGNNSEVASRPPHEGNTSTSTRRTPTIHLSGTSTKAR